jgi:hypothetical protein
LGIKYNITGKGMIIPTKAVRSIRRPPHTSNAIVRELKASVPQYPHILKSRRARMSTNPAKPRAGKKDLVKSRRKTAA